MRSATLFTTLVLLASASTLRAAEVPRLPQNTGGGMSGQPGAPAAPARPAITPPAVSPSATRWVDDLRLTGLSPPGGNLTGLAPGSTYVPGNHVEASFEYTLRSAARGQIMVFTSNVPGNPPHTGAFIPAAVSQGTGRAQVRFSVQCNRDATPATALAITNMRIVLQEFDASGRLVRNLVERQQPASFQFRCGAATTSAAAPGGFVKPGSPAPGGFTAPGVGISTTAILRPDLVPMLALHAVSGTVSVRNQGNAPSAATRLQFTCRKRSYTGGGSGCPSTSGLFDRLVSSNISFSMLDVPALAPGAIHVINLAGWQSLAWGRGTYEFQAALWAPADASGTVAESDVRNNETRGLLEITSPPGANTAGLALPDLVPMLPQPMNGTIVVANIGTTAAGQSRITLSCSKVGGSVTSPGCPESPGFTETRFNARYAYFDVPALGAGATHTLNLPFWGGLRWSSGTYGFGVTVDSTNNVSESNEDNNHAVSTLTIH
jgi:hypothetical protein